MWGRKSNGTLKHCRLFNNIGKIGEEFDVVILENVEDSFIC